MRAGAPAESILNVIFEFYAVFTCYLTYYMPSGKKVGLVHCVRTAGVQCARSGIFFHEFISIA